MQILYTPIEHETRYWYTVFKENHLRRADRPPKDRRATVIESVEFVEHSTFRHVLVCNTTGHTETLVTRNSTERRTLIPERVAYILGCEDTVALTDVDGKLYPVYREWISEVRRAV